VLKTFEKKAEAWFAAGTHSGGAWSPLRTPCGSKYSVDGKLIDLAGEPAAHVRVRDALSRGPWHYYLVRRTGSAYPALGNQQTPLPSEVAQCCTAWLQGRLSGDTL
jgi:hypothetical protein